ncbi:cytochrome P450 [Microvirga roseola]|uniref:cytochrome P450 n=1 Tax=Microvirga roseola TaxID=2883126 RepID=UPI001E2FC312|nr:cytochrome P450 [Microvirga roseola]
MKKEQTAWEVPNITSAELERDAHDAFRQHRASYPIATLQTGGYIVLRYEDVARLSSDPRLQATGTAVPVQSGITGGALFDIFQHGMLTANNHVHERRRSALSRAVASQVVSNFRSHVRHAAEALLEEGYGEGSFELGSWYATKLPALALAKMLGIPDGETPSFMLDIYEMNEFFRPHATADAIYNAEAAASRLQDYLETLVSRKWNGRADDFLSHYLTLVEADAQLSSMEVLIQIIQLIIGGTESVRTAVVAQTANLLSNPEQWKAVCADPTYVPAAVAESLRFEPGIAGVVRIAAEDIEIGESTLPAGQLVILSFMSALRDERVFQRAGSFDIFRPDLTLSNLAFGGGPHRCIADALGRAELEESLSVLTERLPNMRLTTAPVFSGHVFVRRATECWVTW